MDHLGNFQIGADFLNSILFLAEMNIEHSSSQFFDFLPIINFFLDSMVGIKMNEILKFLTFNLGRRSFVWKANFDHHADTCSQFYKKKDEQSYFGLWYLIV